MTFDDLSKRRWWRHAKRMAYVLAGVALIFELATFATLRIVKWGEAVAPNGRFVVTLYKVNRRIGFIGDGGDSYFHLGRNNALNHIPALWLILGSNVLILERQSIPSAIVWLDNNSVLINLNGHLKKAVGDEGGYLKKGDRWNGISISYGVIGEKKYANEVLIDPRPLGPKYWP